MCGPRSALWSHCRRCDNILARAPLPTFVSFAWATIRSRNPPERRSAHALAAFNSHFTSLRRLVLLVFFSLLAGNIL